MFDGWLVFVLDCKHFMEAFQEVAESQQKKEENKDASETAGLLEKLSVEEKKTKDKAEDKAKEEVSVVTKEDKDSKSDTVKEEDAEKKKEEPASST